MIHSVKFRSNSCNGCRETNSDFTKVKITFSVSFVLKQALLCSVELGSIKTQQCLLKTFWIADVRHSSFSWQSVQGFHSSDTPILSFSIGLAGRPHNSVSSILPCYTATYLSLLSVIRQSQNGNRQNKHPVGLSLNLFQMWKWDYPLLSPALTYNAIVYTGKFYPGLVWWGGVVVASLASINEVNLRWAWLVL